MATLMHDLPTQMTAAMALPPGEYTEGSEGSVIELINGDGPMTILIIIGNITLNTTITLSVQEFGSNGLWADHPQGTLPVVTASSQVLCRKLIPNRPRLRLLVHLEHPDDTPAAM
ncbi:MAG: hypothetical protein ACRCZF_16915, partial [Gemmataceae bacterium]